MVIDSADSQGMPFLCAYLVASDEVSTVDIKRYLSVDLPEYMIPARFVRLERMPLTSNGKLDRRSLPAPIAERVAEESYAPPRDETESFLVGQWSNLLEVEEVGIHDHFFELGGNSLQLQQLKMNVFRLARVSVSIADILRHPTPAKLAQLIRGLDREEPPPPLERVPAKPYYRLSDAQNRMYVLYEMNPASTIWNMPGAMSIRGPIDRDRLERCFREVFRRHESLRTSFERIDGRPVQRVRDDFAFELLHGEVDADQVDRTLASFIQPFPLHAAPLVRAGLFRIDEQTHLLVVDIHHIVFDGTSIGILFQELGALYNAEAGLEAPYQYKDFAEWELAWRSSASYRNQERFWLDAFQAAAPPLQLPTDYPRPARRTTEGEQLEREFPAELTASLRRFAIETETTLYMVLMACFSILLSKYSGQEDIVVGSFVSGRTHPDTTNIVGMFVNTLPIRSYPGKEKTFNDYVMEVKQFTLAALENQNYPFAELIDRLSEQPGWHPEWMRAMFTLQNTEHATLTLAGAEVVPYPIRFPYAGIDLSLQAEEAGDRLRFTLNYSTQLFRGHSMERLFDHYARIVEAAMRNPGLRIRELSLEPSNTHLEMQDLAEVTFDF
ncbi:condensation domain-containing protein [Paenibacillus methanolicus]|uniref:condensation domain-containing protein n=1 Tax=Paenibacillus methanolicus TaxID=582686 RepID=UPI003CCC63C8